MVNNPKEPKKESLTLAVRLVIIGAFAAMAVVIIFENSFLLHNLRPTIRGFDKVTGKFIDTSTDIISLLIAMQCLDWIYLGGLCLISTNVMWNKGVALGYLVLGLKNFAFAIGMAIQYSNSNNADSFGNMANDLRWNCVYYSIDCESDIPVSSESLKPDWIFFAVVITTGIKLIAYILSIFLAVFAHSTEIIKAVVGATELNNLFGNTLLLTGTLDASNISVDKYVEEKNNIKRMLSLCDELMLQKNTYGSQEPQQMHYGALNTPQSTQTFIRHSYPLGDTNNDGNGFGNYYD